MHTRNLQIRKLTAAALLTPILGIGFFSGCATSLSSIAATPTPSRTIVEERGGDVKVVKYDDGSWELLVDNEPFTVKGVVFSPVKIGEDPGQATMRDWMRYDDNGNGMNDIAYETWFDANRNNIQEPNEFIVGDFHLLKEMGCNTVRFYHLPSDHDLCGDIYKRDENTRKQFGHAPDKELLRSLYEDFGIRSMIGHFVGSWTIGAGTEWATGTDYTNPEHIAAIERTVKAMVLDHRDEPYVLMWVLGNENNIADWSKCNAKEQPEAYARLINRLAKIIHELDPNHPVAISLGDEGGINPVYPELTPEIDIVAMNSYRGPEGFQGLWWDVKDNYDRPLVFTEWGTFAFNTIAPDGIDEETQQRYIQGCWEDIQRNSATWLRSTGGGAGISIGGTVFDWVDRWYMDGTPHQQNAGTKPWNSPDGLDHEEWFGVMSMGDGSDTLMRQPRKSYAYLKSVWSVGIH